MQATILEETFCRLCLNTIRDSNCRMIEEVIRDVLKIVLPLVNLEENVTHFMCTTCSVELLAAFNFKSVCMDTEDLIFPHINASKMSVIDLKEVYLKEKGNIQLIDVSEDWRICRLCFQPVTYGFVALNEVDVDIIDAYIPQVNIHATRDPVICRVCFDSLRTHGSFLKNCLDVHEKYTNVDKQCYIKTEEIEIKPEDPQDCEALPETFDNEPFEKSDCKNAAEDGCKAENRAANKRNMKTKQECKVSYKCDTCPSQIQMYSCNDCDYETRYKKSIIHHQMKHKDPSQIQMYRCNDCNYETIYKKYMKHHQLKHKDPSQVQKYKCNDCDYETKYKNAFKRHQLTHKDPSQIQMYNCNYCNYRTKYKNVMKGHELKHKDPSHVQMFKCNNCDYETKYKGNLKYHMLKHRDFL